MFFGLQLKPTSPSSLKLAKTLKLSNAVLVPSKNGVKEPVQVVADYENKQFILCILNQTTTLQCPLDILFAPGSDVKLSVKGTGTVHLTGYEIEEDSDEDIPDMSDSSSAEDEEDEEEIATEPKKPEVESSDDEDEAETSRTRHKMVKTSGKKTIVNGSAPKPSKARRIVPSRVEADEPEDEGSSEDDDFDVNDLEDESIDEEDDEDMSDEEELSGEDDMSDEEIDN